MIIHQNKSLETLFGEFSSTEPQRPLVRTTSSIWVQHGDVWQAMASELIDGRVISPQRGESTLQMGDEAFRKWTLPSAVQSFGI